MPATASDLSAGIAPGSLPHGSRGDLEAGLASAIGTSAPSVDGAAGAVDPPVDSVDDPIAALLNGDITPGGGGGPITEGLSVGSGAGPAGQVSGVSPEQARLQQIAMQAKHPLIRQMARNELRRIVSEGV